MTMREAANAMHMIAGCIEFWDVVSKLNCCNTCGKIAKCRHCPKEGEPQRFNCYGWKPIEAQKEE